MSAVDQIFKEREIDMVDGQETRSERIQQEWNKAILAHQGTVVQPTGHHAIPWKCLVMLECLKITGGCILHSKKMFDSVMEENK